MIFLDHTSTMTFSSFPIAIPSPPGNVHKYLSDKMGCEPSLIYYKKKAQEIQKYTI